MLKIRLVQAFIILQYIIFIYNPLFSENNLRSRKIEENKNTIKPIQGHSGIAIYSFENYDNEIINYYLDKYSKPKNLKWIQETLDRGKNYRNFINQRIEHYNLPEELCFLPVIESEFISHAVSRSGAVGIWQFMRNSVGNYMRIDDWVDERRDFWKSTDAALEKLKYNYSVTGDWLLALAAYNCGLGKINRLIEKTGIKDFWKLVDADLLPAQTIHYVPKFLAIARICSYPGRNGLSVTWEDPVTWERIKLDRPVDIALLAEKAGIALEILKSGNTELHYNITPPTDNEYYLKVPAQYKKTILETLENKELKLIRYYIHEIHSGDTLYAVSIHYGVSIQLINKYNPGINPNCLRIGKKIIIPAFKSVGSFKREKNEENNGPNSYHIVKKGDTLWNLSLKYKTTPEIISKLNNLSINSIIKIGLRLKIPGEENYENNAQ